MEYSNFYLNTIIKVSADFGFSDFETHPDSITEKLGIQPDNFMVKGVTRLMRTGKKFTNPFNSWSISSNSESKDINEHVRELLRRLDGLENKFDPEFGPPNIGITFKSNYLYMGSGPHFEKEILAGIAKLGAEMSFDIYQIDQELSVDERRSIFRRITREDLTQD